MAGLPRLSVSLNNLRAVAVPAMAIGGLVAIVGVFVGLQCGGLDKCFAAPTPISTAAVEVTDAAEAPVAEPRLTPDTPVVTSAEVTPATAAPEAAPVTAVTMTKEPAVPADAAQAQRVDDMIGDTFAAIASDDQGWLDGAHSAPGAEPAEIAQEPAEVAQSPVEIAENPVEEGDGAGPLPPEDGSAADALVAATSEAAVTPLERPQPLQVAAFAEEAAATESKVAAAAGQKLAEVASSEPEVATELAVEPEPEPAKPEPVKKVAAATGDTRIVAGAGVNVRSGPGKSSGKLFALAGGEKVKVGENQRGWLKITDDQGRVGWVYKTYLN